MRKIKIALYQSRLKGFLPKPVLKVLSKARPDFLGLPEYFFSNPKAAKLSDLARDFDRNMAYLTTLSLGLPHTVLIGGTLIKEEGGLFFNESPILYQGKLLGEYKKNKLFGKEIGDITPGGAYEVFEVKGVKIAVLICADVLHDEGFDALARKKPDLVFIPTFSPYKEEGAWEKNNRDKNIYVEGAKRLESWVIKICGVKTRGIYPIQGRSLIAGPSGVLWRVPFHREGEEVLKITRLEIN